MTARKLIYNEDLNEIELIKDKKLAGKIIEVALREKAFIPPAKERSTAEELPRFAPMPGITKYGGKGTESACDRGLEFVKRHQLPDGSWGSRSFAEACGSKHSLCSKGRGELPDEITRPALTSLGALCFLGAGYTHKSSIYKAVVKNALDCILAAQGEDGGWAVEHGGEKYYCTDICALALSEAYGMTKDSNLKAPLQKAVSAILKKFDGKALKWEEGAILHKDADAVNIFTVMALKDAYLCGIAFDFDTAMIPIKKYFDENNAGEHKGLAKNGSALMTAEIAFANQMLGMKRDDPAMKESIEFIGKAGPSFELDGEAAADKGMPFVYIGSQAMFQYGGKDWKVWNEAMKRTLLDKQIKGGCADGSWPCANGLEIPGYSHALEKQYGVFYSTCIAILTLEVYYRYPPLFR